MQVVKKGTDTNQTTILTLSVRSRDNETKLQTLNVNLERISKIERQLLWIDQNVQQIEKVILEIV